MEKISGHPRLYRRGATYYHRAAIPADIKATYPKTEETFSLDIKDYQEAVRRVRVAAAEVDRRFENHRRELAQVSQPPLKELSAEQIKRIGSIYYAFRLEEDEETRLEGFYEEDGPIPALPVPSFEEYAEDSEWLDDLDRHNYARGTVDAFYRGEAEEVLTWNNVNLRLDPQSPSWQKVARELQAASIRAAKAIQSRNQGDVVDTPKIEVASPTADTPLLSVAVEDWATEKARTRWVPKTEHEHRVWMGHFIDVAGDKPLSAYKKVNGRAFKSMLMQLPANWNKHRALANLPIEQAANKANDLAMTPMSDKCLTSASLGQIEVFA